MNIKNRFKVLDCTLRDGGYYTNWNFDKSFLVEYLKTMESMDAIDIVELGYRSTQTTSYFGECFYCPIYFMREAKDIAPSKKFAIMLNEKDISANNLDIIDDCIGYIDIVRLAVSPSNLDRSLLLARKIKEKGFKVAINLMYASQWATDQQFITGLKNVDKKIDYLYVVDSYGSMHPEEVSLLVKGINNTISTSIGFHGHNNLELALINSLEALKSGCGIVDVTVSGIGRGAGNLSLELFFTYLNSKCYFNFNLNKISKIVKMTKKLKDHYKWGVSYPYIISGAYSLPQAKVMEWIAKERHDINAIVNSLQNQKNNVLDNVKLKVFNKSPQFRSVLIIGGGNTTKRYMQAIENYLDINNDVAVIHAGCRNLELFDGLDIHSFVCLSGSEAEKFDALSADFDMRNIEVVLSPYPREMGTFLPKDFTGEVRELESYTYTDKYHDSLFAIALQLAIEVNASEINLIGFDGYELDQDNNMSGVMEENQYLIDCFNLQSDCRINSFTFTRYANVTQKSIFCGI